MKQAPSLAINNIATHARMTGATPQFDSIRTMINKPNTALSAITLALLACASAYGASPVPDAGQITRELQKPADLSPPKASAPLRIEGQAVQPGNSNTDMRFAVKSIRVTGSKVFAAAELETLVAELSGAEHSLVELDAGAARISRYYRERGYVVARAYLPVQDIKDGVVVINVLEGALDQQRLTNQSRLSEAQAKRYLAGIQPGDVIHAPTIDRALLLLGDTPGVGGTRAALQPGASVGTTDLLVELDPAQAYSANLELDNYGNRYVGERRAGANVALNSPLGLGDLLSMRAITSGDLMSYGRLSYQLPVGASGLKVGAAYSDTRYKLGEEFASLQAHGTANNTSVFASYPLLRSQNSNLTGTLSWEEKKLIDQIDAVANSNTNKQVQLVTLGLAGNRQDALWGGGTSAFDVSLASGNLTMDAAALAADMAPASANSNGLFSKLTYALQRQQRVSEHYSLQLALSGQQASKNLNSSEKFSLGGANGVRAYPQGEASGDQGMLVNLEVHRQLNEQVQASVFYDAGSADINHDPFAAGANTRFISGAGFGLNGQLGKLQFKTSVAWSTSGGDPVTDTSSHNPRWWLQLSLPL